MPIERPASEQPMPPDAKRVFKGVVFDVYQWKQKMFDGSTATFEKLKRQDTAVVIPVTKDGHLIILEEEQPGTKPSLNFPMGRLEPDEDAAVGAAREFLEETGYAPAPGQELVLWKAVQPILKIDWAVYTFIARKCRKVAEPHLDAGEKIKMKLTTFEDVATLARDGQLGEELAIDFLRAAQDHGKMKEIKKIFGLA